MKDLRKFVRILTYSVLAIIFIWAVCSIVLTFNLLNNPEEIGEFFKNILNGFKN